MKPKFTEQCPEDFFHSSSLFLGYSVFKLRSPVDIVTQSWNQLNQWVFECSEEILGLNYDLKNAK